MTEMNCWVSGQRLWTCRQMLEMLRSG